MDIKKPPLDIKDASSNTELFWKTKHPFCERYIEKSVFLLKDIRDYNIAKLELEEVSKLHLHLLLLISSQASRVTGPGKNLRLPSPP